MLTPVAAVVTIPAGRGILKKRFARSLVIGVHNVESAETDWTHGAFRYGVLDQCHSIEATAGLRSSWTYR